MLKDNHYVTLLSLTKNNRNKYNILKFPSTPDVLFRIEKPPKTQSPGSTNKDKMREQRNQEFLKNVTTIDCHLRKPRNKKQREEDKACEVAKIAKELEETNDLANLKLSNSPYINRFKLTQHTRDFINRFYVVVDIKKKPKTDPHMNQRAIATLFWVLASKRACVHGMYIDVAGKRDNRFNHLIPGNRKYTTRPTIFPYDDDYRKVNNDQSFKDESF